MKKKIMYTSILLLVLSFLSKIIAFVKESVLAYYYGSGNVTDGYVMAQNIVTIIFSAITGAIVIGYITNMTNKEEKNKTLNTLLNVTNLSFVVLVFLMIIFAKNIVSFFAPGFDNQTLLLTEKMIIVMAPFCILYSIHYIVGADLQTKGVFWYIGVQGILANILLILSIVLSNNNIYLLSIGYGLSILAQALLVYFIDLKKGFKYKLSIEKKDENIRKIMTIAYPIFFIEIFTNIILIVDKMFASTLGEGFVSDINYANRITTLVITFFVSVITTVLLPTLVKKANEKDYTQYKRATEQILIYVLLIILPISLGLFVCSKEIIEIIFMRGAFNQTDANITSTMLAIYSFGVPPLAINSILKNQLYAIKMSKKTMIFVFVSFLINIVLNFLLIKIYGYKGLALASVISAYTLVILLYVYLQKKVGKLDYKYLLKNFLKIVFSVIIMVVALIIIRNNLSVNKYLLLCLSGVLGAIIYFICLKLLKLEELDYILTSLHLKRK